MHPILNKNLFFVKEQVGMFKASNNFDIYDGETQQHVLSCREPNLGIFAKMFRFTDYKRMTPFHIEIRTNSGDLVLEVKRGVTFFLSTVEVKDETGRVVGRFKQKFFSIGGKFDIYDTNDQVLCTLKGKWSGWDFKFVRDNVEFAYVTKKWAGFGKEFFTTADNYVLGIEEKVPANNDLRLLIMAAVMCIDMVLKE